MSDERRTVLRWAIVIEGGLIAVAWLLGWWLDHLPLRTFAWDGSAFLWGLAATVPPLVLFFLLDRWPIGPFASLKRFNDEVLRPMLAPCTVVDLIGIAALAGLGEEMVFRGVLQPAGMRWLGTWGALAAVSVLFGFMHSLSATYVILTALVGAYLGALWLYTDNLLAPIVVHALYDLVALLWILRGPEADNKL